MKTTYIALAALAFIGCDSKTASNSDNLTHAPGTETDNGLLAASCAEAAQIQLRYAAASVNDLMEHSVGDPSLPEGVINKLNEPGTVNARVFAWYVQLGDSSIGSGGDDGYGYGGDDGYGGYGGDDGYGGYGGGGPGYGGNYNFNMDESMYWIIETELPADESRGCSGGDFDLTFMDQYGSSALTSAYQGADGVIEWSPGFWLKNGQFYACDTGSRSPSEPGWAGLCSDKSLPAP